MVATQEVLDDDVARVRRRLWVRRALGLVLGCVDALLSRTDRAWLRTQITRANPVPDERRAVVADAARRMIAEGGSIPKYLGLGVMFAVSIINVPTVASLVTFSALLAWTLAQVVRAAVWSRRARRWLAQNA